MDIIGPSEMAKYPFLKESGEYLKSQAFSLEDFGTNPDLKPFVDKAYSRILSAREGRMYKSEIPDDSDTNSTILQKEIFSFLIAIVLIKLSNVRTLNQRFSLQEARSAEKYLEKDLKISDTLGGGVLLTSEKQNARNVAVKIIKDISNIDISKPKEEKLSSKSSIVEHDDWLVTVSDYVTRSVQFHEREWKLVNRKVENGKVHLSSHETVRIIRKELDYFIRNRMNSMNIPELYPQFEKPVSELKVWGKKHQPIIITSSEYPPCIKHAIDVLEKGENLPHSGRFMLATFLLKKGKMVQEIAPLFKNAPDYNEKITLYQLNNLAGNTGTGTEYSCPSCEKLKNNNLCYAIPECDNIINPLQFGKRRK